MGKKFKDLDLSNAFLFAAALEDPQTCQLVLEIILGRKVPKVKVHTEHTILYNSEFRSVRLDVYAQDEFHVSYDLEMQNQNERNLAKRSRYYQAEMDVSSLKPGEDFNGLRPSCIIYICTFDPFGKGLYQYVFEEYCKEAGLPLGDETKKIFLNTKGIHKDNVSQELMHFLQYVEKSTETTVQEGNDTSIKLLHQKVKALKQRRELEVNYMRFEELLQDKWRDGMKQGMAEGIAKGKADGKGESILELLQDLGEVPEDLKKQIESQTDMETLSRWLKLAARSASIEEFMSKMETI